MCAGATKLVLRNDGPVDGVAFCTTTSAFELIYLDEKLSVQAKGSAIDVNVKNSPQAARWGPGADRTQATLAFELKRGGSAQFFVHKDGQCKSCICWFQDINSHKVKSTSTGPKYQGQFEFTIAISSPDTADNTATVSFDLTFVEGFSGGLAMGYERPDKVGITVNATPARPSPSSRAQIVQAPDGHGFPTVLSDKWTENGTCLDTCNPEGSFQKDPKACGVDKCLAACPAGLSKNACGQNACRRYFARQYQDPTSFCRWLYDEEVQGYCWAMDEWMCVGTKESSILNCGFGGKNQPALDLSLDYPCTSAFPPDAIGDDANDWACGNTVGPAMKVPWPAGNPWWPTEQGCIDKKVKDAAGAEEPTNPQPLRTAGTLTMYVVGSSWLKLS